MQEILNECIDYPNVTNKDKYVLDTLLKQTAAVQNTIISESVVSQDISTYSKILLPIVRNYYPRLVAHHLLGVQPMTGPTGYIFALMSEYRAKDKDERTSSALYLLEDASNFVKGENYNGEVVWYIEDNYVLASTSLGTLRAGDTFGDSVILEVYSNKSALPKLLRHYSDINNLDESRPDVNNIGLVLSRKPVAVREQMLRAPFSLELYQDIKSQYGLLADSELVSLITNEIVSDIDAKVISFVNDNAMPTPDVDVTSYGLQRSSDIARELMLHIANLSSDIAITTARGGGNILLCSSKVANLLAMLHYYALGDVPVDIAKTGAKTGLVGTIGHGDSQLKVIVDPYARQDYATVLYRGADDRDAMGFYAPYVPLVFTKAIDPQTANQVIFGSTRYALTTTPGISSETSNDRAQLYARTFNVNNLR